MKRISTILLALVFAVALTGCLGSERAIQRREVIAAQHPRAVPAVVMESSLAKDKLIALTVKCYDDGEELFLNRLSVSHILQKGGRIATSDSDLQLEVVAQDLDGRVDVIITLSDKLGEIVFVSSGNGSYATYNSQVVSWKERRRVALERAVARAINGL